VLGLVVVGTFMTTLDASIVNISLPSIARTFHTPFGGAVEWVIIAYLVVIAARVVGQSLSVALAGAIFARGGATAARILATPAQHGMLVAGELSALQRTFLSSFRAALFACAVFAAIGIGTALVRGHERSPAARIKHENAPRTGKDL